MSRFWWVIVMGTLLFACAPKDQKDRADAGTERTGIAGKISPEELKQYVDKNTNYLIIDVRRPEAFARQTIKGAINIPLEELAEKLKNIPGDTALFFT